MVKGLHVCSGRSLPLSLCVRNKNTLNPIPWPWRKIPGPVPSPSRPLGSFNKPRVGNAVLYFLSLQQPSSISLFSIPLLFPILIPRLFSKHSPNPHYRATFEICIYIQWLSNYAANPHSYSNPLTSVFKSTIRISQTRLLAGVRGRTVFCCVAMRFVFFCIPIPSSAAGSVFNTLLQFKFLHSLAIEVQWLVSWVSL